jgi:hypothetical protein
VPSLGERPALLVGAARCRQQVLAEYPVADDEAGGDPEAGPSGLREERVDGAGEVGAENQGARRAGGHETADELGRDGVRVVGVRQAASSGRAHRSSHSSSGMPMPPMIRTWG